MTLFEICIDSVAGAVSAGEAGAERVELCDALVLGGTTPSAASIRLACARSSARVVVLVRPRGGDFVYGPSELEVMEADVRFAREAGAWGVAIGALGEDGDLNSSAMARLIEAARPMQVTMHRAFDHCRDRAAVMEELITLGVDRILTSGGAADAFAGCEEIAALVRRAAGRLVILPGGGVREHNVAEVVRRTGVSEVHFTAFEGSPSPTRFRNEGCPLHAANVPGEFERRHTSGERIAAYRLALTKA